MSIVVDEPSSIQAEELTTIIESPLLSQQSIEAFFNEGYTVVRDAFPKNVGEMKRSADRMASDILLELQKDLYPYSNKIQVVYLEGAQVVFKKESPDKPPAIQRIVGCGSYDSYLLEASRSERILQAVFTLIGSESLEQLICQCHLKLPGDEVKFSRHQDIQFRKLFDPNWEDLMGPCSYVVCIIPLDRMSLENGGLLVEPFSSGLESKKVAIEAEPGDILFMHPYLWHESGQNLSDQSRMTLLTGFCALGANHRNYPGNCTSVQINLTDQGVTFSETGWFKLDDHSFFKDNDDYIIHERASALIDTAALV